MSQLLQRLLNYKNQKIAIYGLGTETEKYLLQLKDSFEIIGLLDSYRENGILYNTPIISFQTAIEKKVKVILVVARPGSCKAIAKKIRNKCIENEILLIDIRGKNLCDMQRVIYNFKQINGITKGEFLQIIDKNKVISTDLFDTLIMRQTLFSTDVFEIVDARLKEIGIEIEDFAGRRLAVEKELCKEKQCTLEEIYTTMILEYHLCTVDAKKLADIEWKVDFELLVPRKELCQMLNLAQELGKKIYIISDTYYTKQQIIKLLEKCQINFYEDIFVSCEYETGKCQNLFSIVKQKLGIKSWLHIGDDLIADIENAQKNKLQTCKLYSSVDLLEMVGYLGFGDCTDSVQNRIKIGMFLSQLFNSPFQFETRDRNITVNNSYNIGYLFFAPIIADFVFWFEKQIEKYNIQTIWFGARDGYLIKKLYDLIMQNKESVYFLTSRTAAIRAGVENENDIKSVADMKFSGNLEQQLKERFGINILCEETCENSVGEISKYSRLILQNAEEKRENYKKYIEKVTNDKKQKQIAFFDFVAKGTTQMYLSKFVENHIKGFYFLQLEEDCMKDKVLDIISFYEREEKENSAIFDDYYILETMLTAPEPSVSEFDENGLPIYALETRNRQSIECFMQAQQGIIEYFQTYLKICPNQLKVEDKKLDEIFLKLIHNLTVLDKTFLELKVEDPFFNRITDMTDMI